jgi:hypothetical protein
VADTINSLPHLYDQVQQDETEQRWEDHLDILGPLAPLNELQAVFHQIGHTCPPVSTYLRGIIARRQAGALI